MMDDVFVSRIARILYEGVCECCDGYVENYKDWGDSGPYDEIVDGAVDFPALARHVIKELSLGWVRGTSSR
jgi:hypothetical protein